jgi:hypothetical protein
VDRLPYDLHKVRRYFQRLQARGTVRACFEASGAGYVLQRIRHAWRCQHRLYTLFHRLAVKKPGQVAVTAVAREMVGFLWAVLAAQAKAHLLAVVATSSALSHPP